MFELYRRNDIIDLMLDAIRHTDNHGDGAAHESEEDEHEGSKLNHKAKKDTIDEEVKIDSFYQCSKQEPV